MALPRPPLWPARKRAGDDTVSGPPAGAGPDADRPPRRRGSRSNPAVPPLPWYKTKDALAYALIGVPMLVLFIVLFVPIAYNAWVSLHSWSLIGSGQREFIGLDNYIDILQTARWRSTLLRTAGFVVGTVAVQFVIGFGIALVLNGYFRDLKGLRVILLLPMMISEVVVGMAWRLLYEYNGGILNWLLDVVGMGPVHWLGPDMALRSIVIADAWQNVPFVTLIMFAALQTVPEDLLDASAVDGASGWSRLRHIVIPVVQPAILLVLLFRTIFAIRTFTLVWILTEGGPGDATSLIAIDVFRVAFRSYNLGLGAALSWSLVVLSLVIAVVYIRWLNREPLT